MSKEYIRDAEWNKYTYIDHVYTHCAKLKYWDGGKRKCNGRLFIHRTSLSLQGRNGEVRCCESYFETPTILLACYCLNAKYTNTVRKATLRTTCMTKTDKAVLKFLVQP